MSRRGISMLLTVVALTAAGCAYVWHRPHTPTEVMEQDAQQCHEFAQRLMMDLDMRALADRDWPGGWRRSAFGGYTYAGSSLAFRERTAQQCMESKGYRLVKQPPQ